MVVEVHLRTPSWRSNDFARSGQAAGKLAGRPHAGLCNPGYRSGRCEYEEVRRRYKGGGVKAGDLKRRLQEREDRQGSRVEDYRPVRVRQQGVGQSVEDDLHS